MPPKIKISKDEILCAAVDIVREQGYAALNARALAKSIGCSTQPIFSNYSTMEELKGDIIGAAEKCYHRYVKEYTESGKYPPYKASGMAYIAFAKEEKEFFRLLFMRDRSKENQDVRGSDFNSIVEKLTETLGVTKKQAEKFHVEMWICVHGIAVMMATSYVSWDWDYISSLITDVYESMINKYMNAEDK